MHILDLRYRRTAHQRKWRAVTLWCSLFAIAFGYLWWLDAGCQTSGYMTLQGKFCI